jgi:membrane-associated phospholipid phosphatase
VADGRHRAGDPAARAGATTQLLNPALGDTRWLDLGRVEKIYHPSWPNGRSTASKSLALCRVLVVGPRLRPLAAVLGAGYAIAVGYALVALGYHLPSDVFGG